MDPQKTVKQIRSLIRGWTSSSDEQRILQLLASCPGSSLDDVLQALNIRTLVRNLHDRTLGANNRSQLLRFLTVDRLHDLSLETRTDIIWALQKEITRRSLEIAIRNIFLASNGDELRRLRNMVNSSDSHHDLSRLFFSDIDDAGIRAEILDHIAGNQVPTTELKVLSDIDDTVFARLHDRRYPGKTRYPGVLALFKALDRAPDGTGEPGDLTFVTARPGLIAGLVAWFTRRSLRKAGVQGHTILTGSLLSLRSHSHMAERKLENISQYHQLFPEYDLVFVGDSGQGDVEVGRRMLAELGGAVRGVFIHDVTEVSLQESKSHTYDGIAFFDTYIAAAAEVWQAGIISASEALKVGETAIDDLKSLVAIPPPVRKDRLAEHQQDLEALIEMVASSDTGES